MRPTPRALALVFLLGAAVACSREEASPGPAGSSPEVPPSSASPNATAPTPPVEPLPTGPRPKHVLLFTVDTLRADHLGAYGHPGGDTPHLDRLAREGVLFEQAQAPRGLTWSSLTSLLTGRYPISHGVRRNHLELPQDIPLLTHVLEAGGYRSAAFLSNFGKGISDRTGHGFEQIFRADNPRRDPQAVWDERGLVKALEWIREHAAGPTFTWLHFMEPHNAYELPAGIANAAAPDPEGWMRDRATLRELEEHLGPEELANLLSFPATELSRGATYGHIAPREGNALPFDDLLDLAMMRGRALSNGDRAFIAGRYHTQVANVDRRAGRLLALLEELGLSSDTLLIFSADHGEELFEHGGYCFHAGSIHEGVLRVPLILRWPGRLPAGRRVSSAASLVDLLPTLSELLDLALPGSVDGQSLSALLAERAPEQPERTIFAEMQAEGASDGGTSRPPFDAAYAARDARWKLIRNPSGYCQRPQPLHQIPNRSYPIEFEELYDLRSDPQEAENLISTDGRARRFARTGQADAAALLVDAARARARLAAELEAWLARMQTSGVRSNPSTKVDAAAIAALGYLSGAPQRSTEQPIDPGPAFARAVGEAVAATRSAPLAAAAREALATSTERAALDAALRGAGL
ncbi:MAG: sulfatase-like hydrolase/transferase [Planctomycetes bacterium]|nr:sulfatase-like hydrolase/transferase [Planctomycetota bacterium]